MKPPDIAMTGVNTIHDAPGDAIRLESLTKKFRDFWRRPTAHAVDSLSLAVRPGEVFGLLGPNGSGKSTTIKMILGLLHPTSGRIEVLGGAPESPAVRSRIGYLPELSHLYQYLTPRETLDFYGGLFNLPAATRRERTAKLLALAGIEHAADRPVGQFSKGMARRVGLAQALVNDPELVILDEPTSGLDPIGRHDVKDIIRSLADAGKTVLLSSHLLGEVEDVCDRVAILSRGRLRAEGRLDDLLSRQESTRLTFRSIPPEDLRPLLAEIERQTGRAPLVDHPSRTLEQYFLEVLEQTDDANAAARHPQ